MADGRKRARKRGGGSESASEDATPRRRHPAPAEESPRQPSLSRGAPQQPPEAASAQADPGWVARDEPLFFPDESAAPERGGRITLPSSGLAADILARPETAAIQPVAPAAPSLPVEPAPSLEPAAARAELSPRSHNISFFAAPAREERRAVEVSEHLATFFLGREEYGVDVRLVQEIIRVGEVTPVPRAPASIKGVINLRGRIIPVVDLKRKLALGDVEQTRLSRIVVVKARERLIGLLVDGASQVLKVPVATIEAAPAEVMEIDASYIRGVAKLPDRLIILMDLLRILAPELKEASEETPA